ncbi:MULTISPECIES: iron ABC transporter permease [unclassified Sporosarcina]|uniref:ABC transporter permease n=1 Tax=unclassified Sporosarcina TaxID=2647733 RepID=UPI00203D6613|nr:MULTISPECIES: iron ABC transporter permease [unclassified Sporosarcina]GKV65106.1 ABC transporter permease [Sporosarcina sp. NCCP-2331]GLB55230.1 ABC transporter permease [Sporosarcina sp. NCCP-2378]
MNRTVAYLKERVLRSLRFASRPLSLISLMLMAFLFYTIVIPMWEIIAGTLNDQISANGYSLSAWKEVLTSDISQALLYKPIFNTFSIGALVSCLSLLLGTALAWLVTRTNIRFKKTISFLLILPYMLPAWLNAFVWLIIFKNERIGGGIGLFEYIFKISPPDWLAYGFLPIVFSLSTHYYIFAFLLVGAALGSIKGDIEESAEILGASKFQTLTKITFPLVIPAIIAAFILIISKTVGSFGIPALLGLPVRYYTLSTMIYNSIGTGRQEQGFILSLILIATAVIIIYCNQKIMNKRNYNTIGGKGSSEKLTDLGKWRMPISLSVWLFVTTVSILPILILGFQTLMLKDGVYSLSNLTLHYWIGRSDPDISNGISGVLVNGRIWEAFKNTVMIALIASAIAAFIGLIIGYVVTRNKNSLSATVIDQLSFLPMLIPGIALSAIYLSMFATPKLLIPSLYGTIAILVLITIVSELPLTTRAGTSSMIQIGNELEEAGIIAGASWTRRFSKILLPLSKKGLLSGFILVFISAMKELDLLILLVTPKTSTLTTYTFDLQEQGYPQTANAVVFIIITVIIVVYLLITIVGKTDITKSIGGR